MSLILDEHRTYLTDRTRLAAYERALRDVVRPGDVVADLGAGTGILGLLAIRAGAARVYAVEEGSMAQLVRDVARANGLADIVTVIRGRSLHVSLPEPVDVVVGDQLGRFGFEAGVLGDFDDARRRWLKPGGRLVPSRVDLWIAPVESEAARAAVDFWRDRPVGFDFDPAWRIAINTGHPWGFEPGALAGEPVMVGSIDLTRGVPDHLALEARMTARRAATLHGVAGWFSAALAPEVTMTNSPLAEARINRRQAFFPIERAVPLSAGDEVRVSIRIRTADILIAWRVSIHEGGGPRAAQTFAHSTLGGMLIDPREMGQTRLDHVPVLTARGRARESVLALADGRRTVREIEGEMHRRHADLFRTAADAAVFVAEVLTRYAE